MTIEQLSSTKVLISLCNEDMKSFELDFDTIGFCDYHSKTVLLRLLRLALENSGIETEDKTIMLEALPHSKGCMLFVTVTDKKQKRKKYRIKRIKEYPCYKFFSLEELLSAIERLYGTDSFFYNNSVYLYNDSYYLVFDYPVVPHKAKEILSEYATKLNKSKIFIARLYESAKLISGGNAIVRIGTAL